MTCFHLWVITSRESILSLYGLVGLLLLFHAQLDLHQRRIEPVEAELKPYLDIWNTLAKSWAVVIGDALWFKL